MARSALVRGARCAVVPTHIGHLHQVGAVRPGQWPSPLRAGSLPLAAPHAPTPFAVGSCSHSTVAERGCVARRIGDGGSCVSWPGGARPPHCRLVPAGAHQTCAADRPLCPSRWQRGGRRGRVGRWRRFGRRNADAAQVVEEVHRRARPAPQRRLSDDSLISTFWRWSRRGRRRHGQQWRGGRIPRPSFRVRRGAFIRIWPGSPCWGCWARLGASALPHR